MDKTESSHKELRYAIHKLEQFSKRHHVFWQNPLLKISRIIRSLFSRFETDTEPQEILKAIEVISRERYYILNLREGDLAQQKLADSYTKAIENFNEGIDIVLSNDTFSRRIASTLLLASKPFPKINFPQQITLKKYFPPISSPNDVCKKIVSLQLSLIQFPSLPNQPKELFQMKTIALLEKYGIASGPEARQAVKKSSIATQVIDGTHKCTLSQILHIFPGQTIFVKAISEIDPKTQVVTTLFPSTFSVSVESTQTGFPYPSQRNGWALSNSLIPQCPHRLDLLPTLSEVLHKKKKIAKELHSDGEKIKLCKKLIQVKRQVFKSDKHLFLEIHRQLLDQLLQNAPAYDSLIAKKYFQSLGLVEETFDHLSEAYRMINENFIEIPFSTLLKAFAKEPLKFSKFESPNSRYEMASELLDSVIKETKEKILHLSENPLEQQFILCVGSIIGEASKQITLQYFSEDLMYAPPQLNSFEKFLQELAFSQLKEFISDFTSMRIENFVLEDCKNQFRRKMEKDLTEISGRAEAAISNELEEYYQKRHNMIL